VRGWRQKVNLFDTWICATSPSSSSSSSIGDLGGKKVQSFINGLVDMSGGKGRERGRKGREGRQEKKKKKKEVHISSRKVGRLEGGKKDYRSIHHSPIPREGSTSSSNIYWFHSSCRRDASPFSHWIQTTLKHTNTHFSTYAQWPVNRNERNKEQS